MRYIRYLFVSLLAVILIGIALANRAPTLLKALPANFDQYIGGRWQITVPLFLIIFLSIVFGIVIGFIWEWLREAHIRTAASRRATEVSRLEREVGHLRSRHHAPRDEVLAILDQPRKDIAANSQPSTLPVAR